MDDYEKELWEDRRELRLKQWRLRTYLSDYEFSLIPSIKFRTIGIKILSICIKKYRQFKKKKEDETIK